MFCSYVFFYKLSATKLSRVRNPGWLMILLHFTTRSTGLFANQMDYYITIIAFFGIRTIIIVTLWMITIDLVLIIYPLLDYNYSKGIYWRWTISIFHRYWNNPRIQSYTINWKWSIWTFIVINYNNYKTIITITITIGIGL